MKQYKTLVAIVAVLSLSAQAQQTVDIDNIPVDLQSVESTSQGQLRRAADVVVVEEDAAPTPSQGVVILNTNTNTNSNEAQAQAVTKQPTTYVQASPLVDSRAEQLRNQRQSAEIATEQKIVEKLESSRLEDERERAERLFGDRLQKSEPAPAPTPAPVVQQPVQVVPVYTAPVETVNVDADKEDLSTVKKEIIDAVKEVQAERATIADLKQEEAQDTSGVEKYYVGGLLGVTNYDANNVESNGAGGFTLGTVMNNGVIVEGSFLFSNYYLNQWWKDYDFFKEVDQYNFDVAVKYSPFSGSFMPYVGGFVGYTYRKYTDRSYDYAYGNNYYGYDSYPADEEVTSNSVDYGVLIGMDFYVSKNFAIGAEYKYSMNLFNNSDSDFINRSDWREPSNTEPLEEVGYSVFGISGKIAF